MLGQYVGGGLQYFQVAYTVDLLLLKYIKIIKEAQTDTVTTENEASEALDASKMRSFE